MAYSRNNHAGIGDLVTSLLLAVRFCHHILLTAGVGKLINATKLSRDMESSSSGLSFPMRNEPYEASNKLQWVPDNFRWNQVKNENSGEEKKCHLIMLLMGVLERQEYSAAARNSPPPHPLPLPPSLSFRSQPYCENDFLYPHMCLPGCQNVLWQLRSPCAWDQNLSSDLCHPRNIYFWTSFFSRNPKSFFARHECYIIYMQTAYRNTLHMQIDPIPWKFCFFFASCQICKPADTQPGHFLHRCTILDFGSSLPEKHRIQRLGRAEATLALFWGFN